VWAARHEVWGRARVWVNEVDNPIRLQGQYEDEETGLHYNRHRYFDPTIGAFISNDPLGLEAGSNLHRYAPNTWLWADPLGLHSINALLTEAGISSQTQIINPRTGNKHWPNISGSGSAVGSPLGRVGDSEQQLLKHLEDLHAKGAINLKGSFLQVTSEVRAGGHTPLSPCTVKGGCDEALQRFANKHGMTVIYQSDPRWSKSFFHSYKPCS
jgi:RHS repeat-associated protein